MQLLIIRILTQASLWAFILALKGAPWDLSFWKKQWSEFEKPGTSTNPHNAETVLFNIRELQLFLNNFSRAADPSWKTFIEAELKIQAVPVRSITPVVKQSAPSSPSGTPQPRVPGHNLNDNIKHLMSNSSFFFKK